MTNFNQQHSDQPLYPNIYLSLVGKNGNAFAILGNAKRLMQNHDVPAEEIERFQKDATSGDYDHLIQTCLIWFNCN